MSSSPADFTALILSDPHPSLQPRACLVGWETDHTLLLLISFRNCKMGFIIVFISQGSLSILDQHLSLRKHCISVKTGIKSSTHAHLWSFCFVPSTGLAVSLQEGEAGSLPWRGHVPSGARSSFLSTHRRLSPGGFLFTYPRCPPPPTLWDHRDLPRLSALTTPSSQPPAYLMVPDLSPLHLGGWHLRPSNGSGQSPQGHFITIIYLCAY